MAQARAAFDGDAQLRAWLYRIATNVCLDALAAAVAPADRRSSSFAEVPWLQPYPDRLLDEVAAGDESPTRWSSSGRRSSWSFLAALQLLPPRQRAALIARDVLGWPAGETAALLETSVAAANSAPAAGPRDDAGAPAGAAGRVGGARRRAPRSSELLDGFIDAHERCDAAAAVAIAAQDIRDHDAAAADRRSTASTSIAAAARAAPSARSATATGGWSRRGRTGCRRPRATCAATGDTEFRAFKFDVLRIEDGRIAEITTFGAELFPAFGLPLILEDA